jgi:hypothetical protein
MLQDMNWGSHMFGDVLLLVKASGLSSDQLVIAEKLILKVAKDPVFSVLNDHEMLELEAIVPYQVDQERREIRPRHLVEWLRSKRMVEAVYVASEDEGPEEFFEDEIARLRGDDSLDVTAVFEEWAEFLAEAKSVGELSSRTATSLREQLVNEQKFEHFTDDDWQEFGQYVKGLGIHASVFTGILGAMLRYLAKTPRGLPVTSHFAETKLFSRGKNIKLNDFSGGRAMGVLAKEDVVEEQQFTGKQAVNIAKHTARDKKFRQKFPRSHLRVWMVGDGLRGILKYLRTKRVRMKAESVSAELSAVLNG